MHRFYKYQGAGNDFIIFDDRHHFFDIDNEALIHQLCDRNFGIGADGVMLLRTAPGYDFEMLYFNADGRQGTMCGNGGRCIVAFAHRMGIFTEQTRFIAVDGPHTAFLSASGLVKLKMADVSGVERLNEDTYLLDTGSPHYVQAVQGLNAYPVFEEGRRIRYAESFAPGGVNVNFVEKDGDAYQIRTYERGVENETLACGTGATAAAIAMFLHDIQNGLKSNASEIHVPMKALGGDLNVYFKPRASGSFEDVYLEGPATPVFEGLIDVDRILDA